MNKNLCPVVPNELVPIRFKRSYLHHNKILCRSVVGQRFKHTDLLKLEALEKSFLRYHTDSIQERCLLIGTLLGSVWTAEVGQQ